LVIGFKHVIYNIYIYLLLVFVTDLLWVGIPF
jgi:formate/nitrite transporter FocA (FNT family)